MNFIQHSLFVLLALLTLGCDKEYRRPGGEHNLGEVQDLLYTRQLVRDRQMLVTRDAKGWAAMSTQCSHDGCELSYQDQRFLCMCCGSAFGHDGHVHKGPANNPLPYFGVRFVDGKLYADSAKVVSPETRFTTPELEKAIGSLAERIKKEGTRTGMRIPEILLGRGDGEDTPEGMFKEKTLPTPTVE
jgi:nitrite reductase/ring-hydroxylating ferredoxin subunit